MGGDIACSVPRPKGACLWVGLTEIGGVLIVDQIPLCWRLEKGILGPQSFYPAPRLAVLLNHHLGGTVVLVLQVVPNSPEIRLGPPAGLHLAASRQAVALALEVHVVQDGLSRGENKVKLYHPDMSCFSPCMPCQPCGPTPLANSCNEPCVRQCQDSIVAIQPSAVVVTLPGPILTSFPQNTAVGSSTSAAVGSILSSEGVPINSGGFSLSGLGLSGLGGRFCGRRCPPC
uniref:Uncharacterized protein n=1 Tax=Melopsittacus undulatus TaxID=13146 RepID=A0A8V5HAA0_MELUD